MFVISLINDIMDIKLTLNTVCITELITLIVPSTLSGETPNKLPAFPAVAPVIASIAARPTSNKNPVETPAPIFCERCCYFLSKSS